MSRLRGAEGTIRGVLCGYNWGSFIGTAGTGFMGKEKNRDAQLRAAFAPPKIALSFLQNASSELEAWVPGDSWSEQFKRLRIRRLIDGWIRAVYQQEEAKIKADWGRIRKTLFCIGNPRCSGMYSRHSCSGSLTMFPFISLLLSTSK